MIVLNYFVREVRIVSITSSISSSFNFVKGLFKFNNSTTGDDSPSIVITKEPFLGFVSLITTSTSFKALLILSALVLNAFLF